MRTDAANETERPVDHATVEEADYDAYWTHWTYSSQHVKLTPAEFRIALAARVGTIPRFAYDRSAIRCDCGELCRTARDIIAHASRCFQLSGITEAVRHTWLKHGLAHTARAYGIGSTNEPNFYVYPDTYIRHRPDTTFYTGDKFIAIDVTILSPAENRPPGTAARRAAEEKIREHKDATTAANHLFYPVAVETTGHIDKSCFDFFKQLAITLRKRHQRAQLLRSRPARPAPCGLVGPRAARRTPRRPPRRPPPRTVRTMP